MEINGSMSQAPSTKGGGGGGGEPSEVISCSSSEGLWEDQTPVAHDSDQLSNTLYSLPSLAHAPYPLTPAPENLLSSIKPVLRSLSQSLLEDE